MEKGRGRCENTFRACISCACSYYMIPSRKSTPIVTSASAASNSDYLLWHLSMYARRKQMRREGGWTEGDGDGVQMDVPPSSVADAAHALSKRRCDICSGGVGFLVISNSTPSSAAALTSQEQSKVSNNDFDWVSPTPISEPAFTAPSTFAPTITSSEPQPQSADRPSQPSKQLKAVPILTSVLAPAPTRVKVFPKTS
ncbi:hypothetical protein CPC08DRAFT_246407 [Agrocybe pediades]|nr:hypothetical protein CPC08DRAFT_246407 [Agrocybe pediades]